MNAGSAGVPRLYDDLDEFDDCDTRLDPAALLGGPLDKLDTTRPVKGGTVLMAAAIPRAAAPAPAAQLGAPYAAAPVQLRVAQPARAEYVARRTPRWVVVAVAIAAWMVAAIVIGICAALF